MTDLSSLLRNAPAHPINDVLSLLINLRTAEVKTIPDVTLFTLSGSYTGNLVAYDHQEGTLLLQGINNRQVNLTYLQVKAVVAITLNALPEIPALLKFVGGEKFGGYTYNEPVSKLGFRRFVADFQANLSERLGKAVAVDLNGLLTESFTEYSVLKYVIGNIFGVFTGMVEEPLAKEALVNKVKEIIFVSGSSIGAQLTAERLIISLPTTKDLTNVDVAEVAKYIEEVL